MIVRGAQLGAMRAARATRVAAVLAAFTCAPALAGAQAPDERWRSISTEHFVVHFPARLESLARRAGGEAERAWVRLSASLAPPRTPVELVVTDERDISNGQATYAPSNRIVVWAHAPVDNAALRFSDDWLQQVVTHELAHVFHLDRTRGLWRVAQRVFGRHPSLFPNARSPRWLSEGVAVSFESALVGGGRLNGAELHATLDAVGVNNGGRPRTPGRLALATPFAPSGSLPYFAGAAIVDEARRRGGDTSLRSFVDRVAAFPIPFLFWDRHATRAFGASFAELAAAPLRSPGASAAPVPSSPVRVISAAYWDARAPRWRADTVLYTAYAPRERFGVFAAHDGRVRRVADRNTLDAFAFAGDTIVHGDLDFVDPYRLYSSLYVNGARVRGTERLSAPDVRADGLIVAVETVDGGARLVALRAGDTLRRALTAHDTDVQWSAPRWSRDGARIAAVRWMRGGESDIVVLDSTGVVLGAYARARAVQSHPSWDVGDRAIYFTSDRTGRAATYRIALGAAGAAPVQLVARDAHGLYDAEISPDGRTLAAFRLVRDGVELVLLTPADGGDATGTSAFAPGTRDAIVTADGAARKYRALRTLAPTYWAPSFGTSNRNNVLAGVYTVGTDVVGRYSLEAEGNWDVKSGEFYGTGALTYRGFGRPVVAASLTQSWAHFAIGDSTGTLGVVARRGRTASLAANWTRQRVRSAVSVNAGADYEWRDFRASSDTLAVLLDSLLPVHEPKFPALVFGAGWSNATRSALAIGPERGGSLVATARYRWRSDAPSATGAFSLVASARMYQSLPFAGHARHTIALRASAAWTETATGSPFTVGGVSGTSIEILPGYRVGDSPRTFFVRGFAPGVLQGVRAWSAGAEYRAPVAAIGRGLWPLPFFFQRTALAVYGDAASAWCPPVATNTGACLAGQSQRPVIASVGGELLMDMTIDYDAPTRFRAGIAAPVAGKLRTRANDITAYFSLGLPF